LIRVSAVFSIIWRSCLSLHLFAALSKISLSYGFRIQVFVLLKLAGVLDHYSYS